MTGVQASLFDWHPTVDAGRLVPSIDRTRIRGQCRAILERLEAGPATNAELAAISLKYTGRISDLRALGFDIRSERVEKTGTFVYELMTR